MVLFVRVGLTGEQVPPHYNNNVRPFPVRDSLFDWCLIELGLVPETGFGRA